MPQLLKLLSDDSRLRLLGLLQEEELSVQELVSITGLRQSRVSHHLALLRVDGLIECRRDGKHNFYRIVPQRFEEMMELVFETAADGSRDIRLDQHILKQEARARP